MIITIDGPVAAGKTSTARGVAQQLGCTLLDTGAIYRSLALATHRSGFDWHDEAAVVEVARRIRLAFHTDADRQRIELDGMDVSDAIRQPEISRGASIVSAHPGVRQALLSMQRRYGERSDIVVEGRDTGTVVFPEADYKFFLDARPEIRAARRLRDLRVQGQRVDLDEVLEDLHERDQRDSSRAVAPLVAAADSVPIDSSDTTLEEVVAIIVRIVRHEQDPESRW